MQNQKQIFTHNLADYTKQVVEAARQGYIVCESVETWPVLVNNGFFCILVKSEEVPELNSDIKVTEEVIENTEVKQAVTRGRRAKSN